MVLEGSNDVNPTIDYPGKDRYYGRDFSSYEKKCKKSNQAVQNP